MPEPIVLTSPISYVCLRACVCVCVCVRLFVCVCVSDEDYLKSIGLMNLNTTIKFCNTEEKLIGELKKCNLLYLPLTFDLKDDSYDQLSTCFGIKSYEYIQSCRPILVHCPSDYYTSKFFREANAGVIVDRLDASFLENAIDEFIFKSNIE